MEKTIINLECLDIYKFPKLLKNLEDLISDTKFSLDSLELKAEKLKVNVVYEVDKKTYKTSQIRENFIAFELAKNEEYVKIEEEMTSLRKSLRDVQSQHAETRRCFRLLEVANSQSGVRTLIEGN